MCHVAQILTLLTRPENYVIVVNINNNKETLFKITLKHKDN
jgi:hypothetical protein